MGIIYSSNHKTNIAVGNDENDYVIIMNKNENNYDVSIPIVDSNCPCDVSVEDTINESKPIPSVVEDTINESKPIPSVESSVEDTINESKPIPSVEYTINESKPIPINESNCPCVSELNFVINPLNKTKKKKKKKKI